MGREETTLPPTFPVAAAASAWGAVAAAARARGGRRARGWRGPLQASGRRHRARRPAPRLPFIQHPAQPLAITPGLFFFFFLLHFFFFNLWVRVKGARKAPLSGLQKKSSHTLRKKEEEGRRGEKRDPESLRFWSERLEDTPFPIHPSRKRQTQIRVH